MNHSEISPYGRRKNRAGGLEFHEQKLLGVRHEAHSVTGALPGNYVVTPVVADTGLGIVETRLFREDGVPRQHWTIAQGNVRGIVAFTGFSVAGAIEDVLLHPLLHLVFVDRIGNIATDRTLLLPIP